MKTRTLYSVCVGTVVVLCGGFCACPTEEQVAALSACGGSPRGCRRAGSATEEGSPATSRGPGAALSVPLSRRYLQADIEALDIRELTPKFDVILLEPPLEEYYRETGIAANEKCWTWDDVWRAFALGESLLFQANRDDVIPAVVGVVNTEL